ncbi:hypothetical protein PCANB_000985 [Pneumocystis canis]|nr:hypothetical protein PCANB_000985 [Pneumocystis canis]
MFKLLIPASRPRFHVKMMVHDLINVPFVSGQIFIKWHLKDSIPLNTHGRLPKVPIKNHKVIWNHEFSCFLSMKINKHQHLSESWIIFEVNQELKCASHQLVLGKVGINLAEYVGLSKETGCYLLQNSKVNSLLKISISMQQIGGSMNYVINPPQKKQMFYGIADLMSKHTYLDDTSSKKSPSSEIFAYNDFMMLNESYFFDAFHSFEIIESIFNGKDKWLEKSNNIRNGKQYEDNNNSKGDFKTIKNIMDMDKKSEIKMAQEWEIKELEYGVSWSLNRNLNKSY